MMQSSMSRSNQAIVDRDEGEIANDIEVDIDIYILQGQRPKRETPTKSKSKGNYKITIEAKQSGSPSASVILCRKIFLLLQRTT